MWLSGKGGLSPAIDSRGWRGLFCQCPRMQTPQGRPAGELHRSAAGLYAWRMLWIQTLFSLSC